MDHRRWHYMRAGEWMGPIDVASLQGLAVQGLLAPDTPIKSTDGDVTRADRVVAVLSLQPQGTIQRLPSMARWICAYTLIVVPLNWIACLIFFATIAYCVIEHKWPGGRVEGFLGLGVFGSSFVTPVFIIGGIRLCKRWRSSVKLIKAAVWIELVPTLLFILLSTHIESDSDQVVQWALIVDRVNAVRTGSLLAIDVVILTWIYLRGETVPWVTPRR